MKEQGQGRGHKAKDKGGMMASEGSDQIVLTMSHEGFKG